MNKDILDLLRSNDGKFYCLLISGLLVWGIHKGMVVKFMGLEMELGKKFS